MGKSKSNTGIKILDDTVDGVTNTVSGAAKNIERNGSSILQNTATAISTGNFNNFDRTLLDIGAAVFTGGASLMANPDDVTNVTGKETGIERATKEAANALNDEARQAKAAEEQRTMDGIASVISGNVGARMRSPGRESTLLTVGGGARRNTLLSLMGS